MILFGLVLMMASAVFGNSREWYCKHVKDNFQICHKNDKGITRSPRECRCENMQFAKDDGSCKILSLI